VNGFDIRDSPIDISRVSLLAFTVMAFSSLFVIVDPIASIPAFLAMTARDTVEQRTKMARLACLVAAGVLLTFALVGKWIFQYLGITLPAFQMAASLVLLLVALDMIRAQRSRVQETAEETIAGTEKEDIAITPLAIPMLAGPGAISTAVLLHSQARGWEQNLALYLCILAVCGVSYHVLRLSAKGMQWISPIAMKIIIRVMGLLLAALAFQFLINAVNELRKAN
jgi:multiple antibiotic resistance protein